MTYSINDFVLIKDLEIIKKIVDSEIICGQEIYYMDDKTSYSSSQISIIPKNFKEKEIKMIFCDKKRIEYFANKTAKFLLENNKNDKKIEKINVNFFDSVIYVGIFSFFVIVIYASIVSSFYQI